MAATAAEGNSARRTTAGTGTVVGAPATTMASKVKTTVQTMGTSSMHHAAKDSNKA